MHDGSINTRFAKILFIYRLTPQSTTGEVPAELLLGRRPSSRLDLARPNLAERVDRVEGSSKPITMLVPEVASSTLVTQCTP